MGNCLLFPSNLNIGEWPQKLKVIGGYNPHCKPIHATACPRLPRPGSTLPEPAALTVLLVCKLLIAFPQSVPLLKWQQVGHYDLQPKIPTDKDFVPWRVIPLTKSPWMFPRQSSKILWFRRNLEATFNQMCLQNRCRCGTMLWFHL